MRVLRGSSELEMVATFLKGELSSERFGHAVRDQLTALGLAKEVLTSPDLMDAEANAARSRVLASTRGYGEDRELFEHFPLNPSWVLALLDADELACVRYIEYSYWNEITAGTRLPSDAARAINAGIEVFGVSNERFVVAANAVARGARFPPLILAGPRPSGLVCLEGNLRLTAYALAGYPEWTECLVAIAPNLARWAD